MWHCERQHRGSVADRRERADTSELAQDDLLGPAVGLAKKTPRRTRSSALVAANITAANNTV